jgi:hypothetical protein
VDDNDVMIDLRAAMGLGLGSKVIGEGRRTLSHVFRDDDRR